MKKKLVKINAKNVSSKFGYIVEEYEDAALIKVGCKADHMKAPESENCIILGSELYEEVEADEVVDQANAFVNAVAILKADAVKHARWMNDYATQGDLLRNRSNAGRLSQATQTLAALGYDVTSAVWGDGDFLICKKVTIDGADVFKR